MDKYLVLNNFRNHEYIKIDMNCDSSIFVLHGENGVGKTNILEAISMFSGGRGLRHTKSESIVTIGKDSWNVTLSNGEGIFSCAFINSKKLYKVSDKNVRNLNEFLKYHYILWMTYETDRLFVESPANRRNFIDMFCASRHKDHENNLKTYERLTRERLKILKNNGGVIEHENAKWLDIIENRIATVGATISNTRMKITQCINDGQIRGGEFPLFKNTMTGNFADIEIYKSELHTRRTKDFFSNSTTFGPNRSDWTVTHVAKNMDAGLCSAGEQKMLILGVFLSFIRHNVVNLEDKRCLILLLDDVIAHLDSDHRSILFKYIKILQQHFSENNMEIVIWLSGIDRKLFAEFEDVAKFLEIPRQRNSRFCF